MCIMQDKCMKKHYTHLIQNCDTDLNNYFESKTRLLAIADIIPIKTSKFLNEPLIIN